jgi:hypothetical protein
VLYDRCDLSCYAQIGGISLQEINKLEMEFLRLINHRAEVSRNEYEMCRQGLEIVAMGGQVRHYLKISRIFHSFHFPELMW